MWKFILRRAFYAIFAVIAISMISFAVIQLPPGDYITDMINRTRQSGKADPEAEQRLRAAYGFDEPMPVQYVKWISNIIFKGEFGYSFFLKRDAGEIIAQRMPMTVAMVLGSFLLTWAIALPLGIDAAVKK